MAPLSYLPNFFISLISLNMISPFAGRPCHSPLSPSRDSPTLDSPPDQHPSSPPNTQITVLRPAARSDLHAVTTVLTSAYAGTPAWDYGYQYRTLHQHYHWECLRRQLAAQWDAMNHDRTFIRVAEEDGEPVSVSVWRLLDQRDEGYWDDNYKHSRNYNEVTASDTKPSSSENDINCSLHLDQNITRTTSFNKQSSRLRRPYIEDTYGRQLHLEILATHPEFQGHGFASKLVTWGFERAKELGIDVVTLVCEEGVVGFYRSLGFVQVGGFEVRRVDGGVLRFEAMRKGVGR